MRFWRHPSGLLLALSGISAAGLPLGLMSGDPIAAHLVLGLDGMAGAAVTGYLAGVISHWTVGRGPLVSGPLLAALWAVGEALALSGLPWGFGLQALAGLAVAAPVMTSRAALAHRALSLAPVLLPLVLAGVPPAQALLAPAALILWVAGRALPAFEAAEAERRSLRLPEAPPRWPAVVLLALGALWPPALLASGAMALAATPRDLTPPDPASLMLRLVWVALGLALTALGAERLGWIPAPLGLHALGMGAVGPMILAVAARATMARPEGQALQPLARHWIALGCLWAATLARVSEALPLAGALWSLGWAAYLTAHLPALWRKAPAPVFSARRQAKRGKSVPFSSPM